MRSVSDNSYPMVFNLFFCQADLRPLLFEWDVWSDMIRRGLIYLIQCLIDHNMGFHPTFDHIIDSISDVIRPCFPNYFLFLLAK